MIKVLKENPRYLISDDAKIYDTKFNNREICMWVDNTGYLQCNLYDEFGNKVYRRVHRLVAETFIPNPLNLPQVNHKDGNKLNCAVYNLEWATNSENAQHAYDCGLYEFPHLNSYPIKLFRYGEYISTYKSIRALDRITGLNRKTVTSMLKGSKHGEYNNCRFEYAVEGQSTNEMVRVV